jgi:hypothetical protein
MKHLLDREARHDMIADVGSGLFVNLILLAILMWVYG